MTLYDIQKAIDSACRETNAFIQRGVNNLGSSLEEESISDYFLDCIGQRCDGIFITKKFTRHEEATMSGADWLWWVLLPQGACCFHVQAKKLSASKTYLDLGYHNKKNVQIDQLMQYAQTRNAVPLYLFYAPSYTNYPLLCNRFMMNGVCFIEASKLHQYYANINAQINHKLLINETWPIPCLMCSFNNICSHNASSFFDITQFNASNVIKAPDYVYNLVAQQDIDLHSLSIEEQSHLTRFDRIVATDIRYLDEG